MAIPNGGHKEDRIVRELDVVVCAGALGSGTQAVLLQYPLRAADRPYLAHGLAEVKYKPQNKKIQMDVNIDTRQPEYNASVEAARQLSTMSLRSTTVECPTSLAAAFVEGDRLVLVPLDEAMHLRPSLAHLDEAEAGVGGRRGPGGAAVPVDEEEAEGKGEGLMPVMVQVRRRETEAQQEARLRSYAHLSSLDAAEAWVPLRYHSDVSEAAQTLVQRLAAVPAEPVLHAMRRPQYLAALVPPEQPEDDGARAAAGAAGAPGAVETERPGASGAKSSSAAAGPSALPQPLGEGHVAAMGRVLGALFQQNPVCSLAVIRDYLQRAATESGLAAAVAEASDPTLHASALATGALVCMRRVYLLKSLNNPVLDPLRDLILELLAERESIRRSEIVEAAGRRKIPITDALYSKVVRDMCVSRGALWSLKSV